MALRLPRAVKIVAVASCLLALLTGCTKVIEGKPTAKVTPLITQDKLNERQPDLAFWGTDVKEQDPFKEGWLLLCKNTNFPDPGEAGDVDPLEWSAKIGSNPQTGDETDVAYRLGAYAKTSEAKAYTEAGTDAAKSCPEAQTITYNDGPVENWTMANQDYNKNGWTGHVLLNKIAGTGDGQSYKRAQISAFVSRQNISVSINIYTYAKDSSQGLKGAQELLDAFLKQVSAQS